MTDTTETDADGYDGDVTPEAVEQLRRRAAPQIDAEEWEQVTASSGDVFADLGVAPAALADEVLRLRARVKELEALLADLLPWAQWHCTSADTSMEENVAQLEAGRELLDRIEAMFPAP
jgi:hypothetical protein